MDTDLTNRDQADKHLQAEMQTDKKESRDKEPSAQHEWNVKAPCFTPSQSGSNNLKQQVEGKTIEIDRLQADLNIDMNTGPFNSK